MVVRPAAMHPSNKDNIYHTLLNEKLGKEKIHPIAFIKGVSKKCPLVNLAYFLFVLV